MPRGVPDVDVRIRADDAVAELLLQTGHQRQRDDERHDADGDAERRDERDDGDERLLPLGEQVAERDVELEGHVHHRRNAESQKRESHESRTLSSVFSSKRFSCSS